MVSFLEAKAKDKTADKADHDANVGKRIPAAKALQKAVEAALPAIEPNLTTKNLDKYEDGKAWVQAIGAGMLVHCTDVYNKYNAFLATIGGAEGVKYKNEVTVKIVSVQFNHWQDQLGQATKLINALRTPPARPAAQTPPKPAAPARPGSATPPKPN